MTIEEVLDFLRKSRYKGKLIIFNKTRTINKFKELTPGNFIMVDINDEILNFIKNIEILSLEYSEASNFSITI